MKNKHHNELAEVVISRKPIEKILDKILFSFDFNSLYPTAVSLMDSMFSKIEKRFFFMNNLIDDFVDRLSSERKIESKLQKFFQLFQDYSEKNTAAWKIQLHNTYLLRKKNKRQTGVEMDL